MAGEWAAGRGCGGNGPHARGSQCRTHTLRCYGGACVISWFPGETRPLLPRGGCHMGQGNMAALCWVRVLGEATSGSCPVGAGASP